MKYLILLLLSFNALAEQEINLSYSHINQDFNFANRIEFDMLAASVSYSYFTDMGLGVELGLSRSKETKNTIKLDTLYENKINFLWSGSVVYKYELSDNFNVKAGVGITEYKSTWKVNGVEPSWSKGSDSYKPSWFLGLQYKLTDSLSVEFSRRYMYKKMKADKGEEVTYAHNIGFTYSF